MRCRIGEIAVGRWFATELRQTLRWSRAGLIGAIGCCRSVHDGYQGWSDVCSVASCQPARATFTSWHLLFTGRFLGCSI